MLTVMYKTLQCLSKVKLPFKETAIISKDEDLTLTLTDMSKTLV